MSSGPVARSAADAELLERISRPSHLPGDIVDRDELKLRLSLESEYLAGRILAQLDEDGDGFVSRTELVSRVAALMSGSARDRLRFVFGVHDEDGNDFIDRDELLRMLRIGLAENRLAFGDALVDDLADALFTHADADGDGRISFEEFATAVERYPGLLEQMALGDLRWLGLGPTPGPAAPSSRTRAALGELRSDAAWILLLSVYAAANLALFALAFVRYRELGGNVLVQVARGCGACLNLHGALILVPMMRHTQTVLGRTAIGRLLVDDHVAFHRLVGTVGLCLAIAHGAAHGVNVALAPSTAIARLTSWAFVTGLLLLAVHATMFFFARDRIRRSGRFELFASTHRLWPAWMILLLVHGPVAWAWMVVPGALYGLDRLVGRRVRTSTILAADVLPSRVTRLVIARPLGLRFTAADYVYVRLRALAPSEWHPFTISSPPEREDTLTLHVRSSGNWTNALHALASEQRLKDAPIDLDGPYGTPSARIFESEVAVLVAAGIGVTPFASVLSSLLERHRRGLAVPRVHFVWVCKEQRAFEWFADLLAELERAAPELFCIHIYMDAGRPDLRSTVLRVAMDALYAKSRADLVTGLCARTTLGAPEWDALLESIVAPAPSQAIDAFYCGPIGLAKIVRAACVRRGLHFRQEHF